MMCESANRRSNRKRGMNVGGKLIIQGKAWGEFENAKRSKGNIEISGYRSYGGTHTVRMVDQPQLNENQQIVLEWLKLNYDCDGDHEAMWNIFMMYYYQTRDSFTDRLSQAIENLTNDEQIEILREYSQWALEQEG
ncbi:hypothetical protein [Enterococcus gallinarum]|uniref:hypothetical protein n=1 Tax=Enterococcus gallinarum TaxID=1353 RepID=UPI000763CE55|nr:hypothetical protein [Enterococcus gallinarum]